jgi:Outer membrane protein beta-barrel domain
MKTLILTTFIFATIALRAQVGGGIIGQVLQSADKKFDGETCVKKGDFIVQLAVGTPNNVANKLSINTGSVGAIAGILGGLIGVNTAIEDKTSNKVGPIQFAAEYFTGDKLSIGVQVLYASGNRTYKAGGVTILDNAKISVTQIMGTSSFHVAVTDKLDPYIKAAVGVALWKDNSPNANFKTLPEPLSYNGILGLRYFFNPDFAIAGEASFSNLNISANLGVTYKFKRKAKVANSQSSTTN